MPAMTSETTDRLIEALENYAYGRKSLTECDRFAHKVLEEIFPGRNDRAARKLLGGQ